MPGISLDNAWELVKQLAKRLRLDDWDHLVVGDGSGSNWSREIGWSAVCAEKTSKKVEAFVGFASRGSVNVAEILALQWPLMWLAAREIERQEHGGRRRAYQVHLVTDSQYVQGVGDSGNRLAEKNAALWAHFETFKRLGIVLHWHWIPRLTHPIHQLVDELSKLARTQGAKYNLLETQATRGGPGESDSNVADRADDDD